MVIPRMVALAAGAVLLLPAIAHAADGDLEATFNGTGKVSGTFGGSGAQIFASVVQPDGKLVVAGSVDSDGMVARFNTNGTPDSSFGGGDGITVVDSGSTAGGERLRAVALQGDKIIAAGDASTAAGTPFVVARLTSDGQLDDSFDGPGGTGNGVFRITPPSGSNASGSAIVASGSQIIFGGSVDAHTILYRLNDTGTLDTTGFGSPNGYLTFDFGGGQSFLSGLAIQPSDNKIVAVGHPNATSGMGVARITTAGALDTTFNPGGGIPGTVVLTPPTGYLDGFGSKVIADSSGEMYVAGFVAQLVPSTNRDPAIAAVTSSGSLDTASFGGGTGYALLPLPGDFDQASAFARQPDGKFVIGGTASSGTSQLLIARFSAAGVLDTTFASPIGYATTDFGTATQGSTLALAATGTAYVGGNAGGLTAGIAAFHAFTPPPTGGGGGPSGGGGAPAAPVQPRKKCKKKKHKSSAVIAKKCKKKK